MATINYNSGNINVSFFPSNVNPIWFCDKNTGGINIATNGAAIAANTLQLGNLNTTTQINGILESNTVNSILITDNMNIANDQTTGILNIGQAARSGNINLGTNSTGTITVGGTTGPVNIAGSTIKQDVPCLGGGIVSTIFGNANSSTSMSTTFNRKSTAVTGPLSCYTITAASDSSQQYNTQYFEIVVSGANFGPGGYSYKGCFCLTLPSATIVPSSVTTLFSYGGVPAITFTIVGTTATLNINTTNVNSTTVSTSQTFVSTLIAYPTMTIFNALTDYSITAI